MERALASLAASALLVLSASAEARTLLEYKRFRSLSLDLTGRLPSAAELKAFEDPSFAEEAWIDARLAEPAVADRIGALYAERLRIGVPEALNLTDTGNRLAAVPFRTPDGSLARLYYRFDQRRTDPAIDRRVCLTDAELGYAVHRYSDPLDSEVAGAIVVPQALIDSRIVKVKPWWAYEDFDAASPKQWIPGDSAYFARFAYLGWDEKADQDVYVCREETQANATGTVDATVGCGEAAPGCPDGAGMRWDTSQLTAIVTGTNGAPTPLAGSQVSCIVGAGREFSHECGCGPGLSWCVPAGTQCEDCGYFRPILRPLDPDTSFGFLRWERRRMDWWVKYWWLQELRTTVRELVARDGDFRDLIAGKGTWVNGPLAWYYGTFQRSSFDLSSIARRGPSELTYLFDPAQVPAMSLHDDTTWQFVPDRGPNASGILTSAAFLHRYAARRGRAHAVYQVFRCEDFDPPAAPLSATLEPNLMKAPGCQTCHTTLEPMAAYFARTPEVGSALSPMMVLDPGRYPTTTNDCRLVPRDAAPGYEFGWTTWAQTSFCQAFYEAAQADGTNTPLLGAYGSPAHADLGPRGLADEVLSRQVGDTSQYAACAAKTVAEAWLGRSFELGAPELESVAKAMETNHFSMRALIRALVLSDAYRFNNMSSDVWRARGSAMP